MNRLSIVFLMTLGLVFSYDENEGIKQNLLKECDRFFEKERIEKNNFQCVFYIKGNEDYVHYVLRCTQMKNNDSLIIYFSRDDTADYFIQSNDNFRKYYP